MCRYYTNADYLSHGTQQALRAGLGFAECRARMVPLSDDELTIQKPYLQEHEEVQTRGWVFYGFNVTDEDYQVVVNVAEEEGSQCKLPCTALLLYGTNTICSLRHDIWA